MSLTIPNTSVGGTPADADEVNANFTAVKDFVDGLETDISSLETDISTLESNVLKPDGSVTITSPLVYASGVTSLAINLPQEIPSLGKVQDLIAAISIPSDVFSSKLLHVQDEKTADTHGGTFTAGAWRTRDLNTVKTNEITGASVTSNVITLPAGTYYCDGKAPAYTVGDHKTRLRKTNGTAVDLLVSRNATSAANFVSTDAIISGRFTLSEESTIELQHICDTTVADYGFGALSNFDSKPEIYSDIKIWKVV